jgi:glucose/mannose-6-phosphate isomerase
LVTFQADPSGMSDAIAGMAEQLRAGERTGAAAGMELGLPAAVVMAGMGGSAMGGELLRALVAADCPVPITRVRGFGVPAWAGPGTLVVCTSYSGDTAETLACARQAHAQGAALLGVASGGELARLAEELGFPCALVPGGMQPRAALGYLFGAMAGAFAACGLSPDGIAEECAQGVEACDRDAAAELGRRLAGSVPLVYGAGPLGAVAYRWKTQFNENAKMHAFSHAFPELDHNEIVAWEGAPPGTFAAVLLRDPGERDETRRMIEATAELIAQDAVLVEQVEGRGDTAAARAFSMVAHGDWVSYHAALERGVNPTPVDRIGTLKQRIGE